VSDEEVVVGGLMMFGVFIVALLAIFFVGCSHPKKEYRCEIICGIERECQYQPRTGSQSEAPPPSIQ
jgi:hypothetical protein